MYKANKEIQKVLSNVDLVIEVLDARIPYSSENPVIAEHRGDKPTIKVFNKSDLADAEITTRWQQFLEEEQGVKTLATTRDDPERIKQIMDLCKKLIPHKVGGDTPIYAMIMGIPNVGKSTLINTLAGRTIAKTGNEPAVTKHQQRIDLKNGVVLIDTPGVLWPNIENSDSGYRLAMTGAVKDTAISYDDVAFYAAEYMMKVYPERLSERYELDELPETEIEFMEQVGAKRGCLRGGGDVDLEKISKLLLAEYRSGKLGRLTLETPEMMTKEKRAVDKARAEKAAKLEAKQKPKKRRRR
ncbi:MAG: 50S ribosomal subunit maturation GTPase RbgA (B. subtilis YlqF) [uncultured Thiotrichaceae bacterium]|uniref:Ribosome biogenesis GTPase A n=1 Tax=uncultured Thiotrichaceae bacterium TaxID=298394 RepID=A0A6S6TY12_9GAMM|nr:MAG: 50S ribosomal subunit maturation GTPase RbgA (B. subtilis YlqF) [uncultured Thiotrichaceae bacterium]